MATSMGHSYDTWRKHYDKQRGSREQGIGRAAFTKYVEEEMAHPAAPSGSAQKKKTAAPPAPGAQAEAPVLVPAGAEAEAGIGAEHALQEAAAAEPPSRPASPAGPVPVPGGSLAALLEAEAEAQAQAEAEANAPKRERPSLLDALLAQGGKLRFGSGGGLRGPKPSPKANGRPAGEYAWKWLKADVAPFSEADVRQITGAKALKMLIASCIEQPDGKAEFPGSNRVPYLQAVLLAARPRPRGM